MHKPFWLRCGVVWCACSLLSRSLLPIAYWEGILLLVEELMEWKLLRRNISSAYGAGRTF